MISENRLLFFIVLTIGIFFGGLGTHLFYKRKSDIDDGIVKARDSTIIGQNNKISDLKDFTKSAEGKISELKNQVSKLKGLNESLQNKTGRLENQIITLKELKAKNSVLTPKEIESKVQGWLIESGHTIRKVQTENSHFGFFVTNEATGNRIEIRLFKSQETLLRFQVNIAFLSNDQEAINKLSQIKLNELLANIKTSLVNLGLDFEVKSPLKTIKLDKILFVEILTRPNFYDVLGCLDKARVIVSTYVFTALKASP